MNFRSSKVFPGTRYHSIRDKCSLVVFASCVLVFLSVIVGVTFLNNSSYVGPTSWKKKIYDHLAHLTYEIFMCVLWSLYHSLVQW